MNDHTAHDESSGKEPGLPQLRRGRVKTVALGVALLVSGAVIGSGLTLVVIKRGLDKARDQPSMLSQRMLSRMERHLDLTPDQSAEIREIFQENRKRVHAFRERHHERAQSFMEGLHDDVAAVLNPEQREKWDAWYAKARKRAFRHRPPKSGEGPAHRREGDRPPPSPERLP